MKAQLFREINGRFLPDEFGDPPNLKNFSLLNFEIFRLIHYYRQHSRPQSPRSFWSAPGIETSGRDRSRKSANHGLPAFVRGLRNLNNNGYYRLQKWAAIALARYLVPARGLDPWRRPKGSWALGTRMYRQILGVSPEPCRRSICPLFHWFHFYSNFKTFYCNVVLIP